MSVFCVFIKNAILAVPDPSDGFFLVILNSFQDLSAEKGSRGSQ